MTYTFKKLAVAGLIAAGSLSVASGAYAQARTTTGMNNDLGWYAGIGAGTSDFQDLCGGCDDKDSGWKVFGGYNVNNWFGVELGYHELGRISGGGLTSDLSGLELSGVGRWPITPAFSVFGKVGAFRSEADGSLAGNSRGTDWTWGVGASYAFTPKVSGRLEWQQFRDLVNTNGADADSLTASVLFKF